jgi:hypothetical protein
MPVSKKRKKHGKPVQRREPETTGAEHAPAPDAKPEHPVGHGAGRPTNPFVQQQQGRRGALRGR